MWDMGLTETGTELGFGLSTSNMLINLLSGRLELTSLPWYKTEAKFSFPVKLGNESTTSRILVETTGDHATN